MKRFLSLFAVNMSRAIFSARFVLSACTVALVMFFAVWGFISTESDVIYLCGLSMTGSGAMILIICVLPIIPFATTYASERNEHSDRFWMIRTGVGQYSANKVLVAGISGFFTTSLGILIFILLLLTKCPLFTKANVGDGYSVLLVEGKPLAYLSCYIIHVSLSSAIFAVLAFCVSTFIPNKFTAVAAPAVLYFIALRFTETMNIPQYLKAGAFVEWIYDAGTPASSLLLKAGTVITICFVLGYCSVKQIQRRLRHE